MASSVSIGAFYNPHLALETLAAGDLIGHLAMADPPGQHDPAWPEIRARYTLLLHDYLGQLSEPFDEEELGRARSLLLQLPLERVIEMHVSGHAPDPDLEEPWIAPILPNREILDLAELAAARAPGLRAITFDAFSPSLRPETLLAGVRMLRERFGQGG